MRISKQFRKGCSRKFGDRPFPEARCLWSGARTRRRVPPVRRGLSRSGGLKLKGDRRTVEACFLSLFLLPEPAAVEE